MRVIPLVLALGALGCGGPSDRDAQPITVFAAASLARPLAVVADTFAAHSGHAARLELGGSLDHVRRVTDLGRTPDVLLLADDAVMASLMPAHIGWYVRFATSPIVVAWRPGSAHAAGITSENWWRVLSRTGVSIGRADSTIAPAGRHALSVLRRAEAFYREPGLTQRLMANARLRDVRPNATELAALLEAGAVDFILEYESVARQYGFEFMSLPANVSAGVLYGIAIPRSAPQRTLALEFATLMLSEQGKRALRDAHFATLRVPVAVGDSVPPEVTELVRTLAARPAAP